MTIHCSCQSVMVFYCSVSILPNLVPSNILENITLVSIKIAGDGRFGLQCIYMVLVCKKNKNLAIYQQPSLNTVHINSSALQ